MSDTTTEVAVPASDDIEARKARTEELKALGFDPKNPSHRAAVKIADKYGLDLALKEVVVIDGKGAYITRDGLLAVAHRSGVLDGIVVEEETDTETHWTARVSVFRTDMTHPFTYRGRYPHGGSNKAYGPEMAVKCAEVMALRRAFRVTGAPTREEAWDDEHDGGEEYGS